MENCVLCCQCKAQGQASLSRACRCVGRGCESAVECCVDRTMGEALDVLCSECRSTFCFNCKEEAHRPVSVVFVCMLAESDNQNSGLSNSLLELCTHASAYSCLQACTRTHSYAHTHTHTRTHTHAHTHTLTCTYIHTALGMIAVCMCLRPAGIVRLGAKVGSQE